MSERLHKYLSRAGVASRRKAEQMIAEGLITVNGEMVTEMGVKVDATDDVRVNGERVHVQRLVTILLNKPTGVITSLGDPQKRQTISRFLPELGVTLRPIGRLDYDSSGMLLCTTDGDLAYRLTHPRYHVEKEYDAVVVGAIDEKKLDRLRKGIHLEDGMTAPAKLAFKGQYKAGNEVLSKVRIIITEGRNRQVRRMFEAVGHPVKDLKRVRIGSLRMSKLGPGHARVLGDVEVAALRKSVGLSP